MSGDTVETLLAAYLILGPVGAAAGMMIIALRWLRPRAHRSESRPRVVDAPLSPSGDLRDGAAGRQARGRRIPSAHTPPVRPASIGRWTPPARQRGCPRRCLEQFLGVDAGTEPARQHPAMSPSERGAVAGVDEHRLA